MFDLFWFPNFIKNRHIAILGPNLSKLSRSDISNIIFMINELDLLWVPNFIALRFISFLGPNFPGMRRFILVSMSNVRCLAEILIFLVATARYFVVTAGYCSFTYWLLLVVPARYRSLLLVPTFSMNFICFRFSMSCVWVSKSWCRGFLVLQSRCRVFWSWNPDVVVNVPPRPRFRFH